MFLTDIKARTGSGGAKTHYFLQAEGPQCHFGLLSAPCRGAEVLSKGGNRLGGGAQVRP